MVPSSASPTPAAPKLQQTKQRRIRSSPAPQIANDGSVAIITTTIPSTTISTTTPIPSIDPVAPITSLPASLPMASPIRLLVCSIGNPAPYLNTLHSAGHTVLTALASTLLHPPFSKSRAHGNGLLSPGPVFTLYQSPSLMNISGTPISSAWSTFQRTTPSSDAPCALVIVHDELELGLGEVKVRSGSASPKGHNGLKSIRDKMPGVPYTRIGVGIGRPASREPDVVARYVLRKMMPAERLKIEGAAGRVEMELRRLAAGG